MDTARSAPRVLVLRAPGTNCDEETIRAWRTVGAEAESIHILPMIGEPERLDDCKILTVPGGFSYGDDLGAGLIFGLDLSRALGDRLRTFHERGGLILGICNGFQALVRAGLLPGDPVPSDCATLTHNDSARYECRWVRLKPQPGRSPFLPDGHVIEIPVAHAEGKFITDTPERLDQLERQGQIALRYVDRNDAPTLQYPENPNGSLGAVAGLTDSTGRILGLMPHPERHIDLLHHPQWTRLEGGSDREPDGLRIFHAAIASLNS